MQKRRKIFMLLLALLLCLTLISSCILSGTMAKYAKFETASASVSFKKWGLEVENGTDLASSYSMIQDIDGDGEDDTFSAVSSTQNVVAPGTRGCLAWVRIKGTPEVAYNVDFSGEIAIGEGFSTIVDEIGRIIDYFPIAIYLCRYDYDANGNETKTVVSKHCVVRLTPDSDPSMTPTKPSGEDSTWDGKWRMSFFKSNGNASKRWGVIDNMVSGLNSSNSSHGYSLNNAFDVNKDATESINSIYAVEWEWAYQMSSSSPSGINISNAQKGDYTYQTRELDTQLAEAMRKDPESFKITADLDVNVTQAEPS